MILPAIHSRIEEPHEDPFGRQRANVGSLGPITKGTRIREVADLSHPAMFFADHMVNLTPEVCIGLMNQAILA